MPKVSVQTLVAADAQGTGPTTVSRVRGGVLMVLGPLLALGMLAALVAVGPALWLGPPDGPFAGSQTQALAALALMLGVGALGVLFTWGGWNLWRQGRLGRAVALPSALLVVALLGTMPWLKALFA
jgi:hypothetical protein